MAHDTEEQRGAFVEGDAPPERGPGDDFAGHDPLAAQPPPAGATPVVVPRWVQLVMLPLAILALWTIARAAGAVLLVFVVAAVVALILNPLVSGLHRFLRLPRGLAVAAVYVGLLFALTGAGFLLANPIATQAQSLTRDVPRLVDSANNSLASLQRTLDKQGLHIQIKRQGETAVQTLADKLGAASSNVASTATGLLKTMVTASLGLILVLVLSIYMLVYGERIGALVRRVMPPGDGTPEDDYPMRVQRAVSGYVRGQLLFSVAMGTGAGLSLWLYGVLGIFDEGRTYALAFGIFFALMELIPFIGPFLGALPPLIVALFHDPLTALWVGLLFTALQQIEGHVVAPQIFGHTLRINPLLVIFALLLGGEIYGFLGALIALPLAAVARETAIYLRRHLVLEPWGRVSPIALAETVPGGVPPGAAPPPAAACVECGAPAGAADAFCRSCGTPLASAPAARR
jgi:predicted PurR-regulated permease PerM